MLDNGSLRIKDENGNISEIGPQHPDYQRLAASYRSSLRPTLKTRIIWFGFILVGLGAWWYGWHQLVTEGSYDLRVTFVGPVGVFGGLMLMIRPDWGGPWRPETPTSQKLGIMASMAVMLAAGGINYYLMQNYRP